MRMEAVAADCRGKAEIALKLVQDLIDVVSSELNDALAENNPWSGCRKTKATVERSNREMRSIRQAILLQTEAVHQCSGYIRACRHPHLRTLI